MNKVSEKIIELLRGQGVIPFQRFMEVALYCPDFGYYEREKDTIGRGGDYYTSVSVGSLFGELLAFQFAEWLCQVHNPESTVPSPRLAAQASDESGAAPIAIQQSRAIQIVEAGANDGHLAEDILIWLREHRPELFQRLKYWIIEPSERRRQWQQRRLAPLGDTVRWAASFAELAHPRPATLDCSPRRSATAASYPSSLINGIIFCNELLDALPVRRFGWDAKRHTWFEWGVKLDGGRLAWARMPDAGSPGSTVLSPQSAAEGHEAAVESPADAVRRVTDLIESAAPDLVSGPTVAAGRAASSLEAVLPDGFCLEVCAAAEAWWSEAAHALGRGKLVAIDYGLAAEQFFSPERRDGTLRAYRNHRQLGDVLADPGEQDITAHVNFSAIRAAGEAAGLRMDCFQSQTQFLTAIAARLWAQAAQPDFLGVDRARQFHTLTHPDHLGRAFKVLVQSRGE